MSGVGYRRGRVICVPRARRTCAPRTRSTGWVACSARTSARIGCICVIHVRTTVSSTATRYSQTTAVETRYEIWYALPLDTHVGRQDVIANSQCHRQDQQSRCMEQRRKRGAELSHVDDDLVKDGEDCRTINDQESTYPRRLDARLLPPARYTSADCPDNRLTCCRSAIFVNRHKHRLALTVS